LDTYPTFGVFFMAEYDKKLKPTIADACLVAASGCKALAARFQVIRMMLSLMRGQEYK
jgi:hypothetical protein